MPAKKLGYSKSRVKLHKEITQSIKKMPKTLFPYTDDENITKAGFELFKKKYDEMKKKGVVGYNKMYKGYYIEKLTPSGYYSVRIDMDNPKSPGKFTSDSLKSVKNLIDSWIKEKKKIGAVKSSSHKDTKSHNVNIKIVSGMKKSIGKWKKGSTTFVEKKEKAPKRNAVRVTRSGGQFSKFRSIGNLDNNTAAKKLVQFAKTGNPMEKYVIKILVSRIKEYGYDRPEQVFTDILYNGLQSGIISEMIYYSDTLAFYKKYKKYIMELLQRVMDDTGAKSPAEVFGKNWDSDDYFAEDTHNRNLLAWFGFEETTRDLAYKLGIEI
jgi:hypothetical protein